MKQLLLLLILILSINLGYSQQQDPQSAQFNYVPGKIIVKLKDNVKTNVTYSNKGVGTTQADIGKLLGIQEKVAKSAVLFSEKSVQKSVARKNANKQDSRVPNPHTLKNTFLLELSNKEENVLQLAEELSKRADVEYAEPDYNYSVNDFTVDSDIIYPENATKNDTGNGVTVTPDDPLYAQQTNITLTNIDKVWDTYTTGNGSQIIAILDTGVDYTHPDLAANIWINQAELNGVEGFDDDANGYIDDIRGWDFINIDNTPLDDNMHGTHVAGIAGAVGGNGIGIAGAAWNVKLMPIKVFQSNGVGNSSTIAQGIEYATNNGATIQNMSFGSYAESMTMRNALENAYATSVLVAAAGNDATPIGPCIGCAPLYPGAYTYVIGVEDVPRPTPGGLGYTNYDQDGPIFSGYSNLLNYELKAPGSGIMSTVPNGGYRTLTGTSMSSPLVAGGIALYLQNKPEDSKELLFGNLINTSATYVDVLAAIQVVPSPELKVLSAITKDTITGQNGNGYLEPNEIIEIFPLVKNYWGPTDDVRVGIEFAEFEDQTKATILESEIAIGSITAYATLQVLTKSLKIQIASNVANNVNIKFNLKVWSGPNQDYLTTTEFIINVKNSILLYGVVNYDLTLSPDKEYLVSDNLIISENATLTIKPGTIIKISDDKKINLFDNSRIIAQGTKDSLIVFKNENNLWKGMSFNSDNSIPSIFDFVRFENITNNLFGEPKNLTISNSLIINSHYFSVIFRSTLNSYIYNSNFYDNFYLQNSFGWLNSNNLNIIRNISNGIDYGFNYDIINEINIFDNIVSFEVAVSGSTGPINAYVGTSDTLKYKREVLDAETNSDYDGLFNTTNISNVPYESNHGIVWKVLVNGQDAQDEYDLMDPVGVGTQTFTVYFNRTMDTNYPPQISYGVREPYNQKIISETGTWSPDGKIYTVTHEVKIGAADGINRIRVQGSRDLDYFDIPIEDSRFNMLVQSAGSASAGFMATPGLGEITLDWEVPDATSLEDVLGYNMYRYKAITDTTFTDLVKLNESLIVEDTDESTTGVSYTDYDVEEGTKYFYQYKILRTSLEETDYSKTVAAQPLTSQLGDSNGDFSVNVLDLVQDVDHILGNNPQPFIFKAADVNADGSINVLDIVGTVDIINSPATSSYVASSTNPELPFYSNVPVGEATFYWEGDDLFVESKHSIGGLQLAFEEGFQYSLNSELSSFEWSNYGQEESRIVMMYSFSGLSIAPGKTKLLTRLSSDSSLDIERAVTGTPNGLKLTPKYMEFELEKIEAPAQKDRLKIVKFYPNPTAGEVNLKYYLPANMDMLNVTLYSMQGEVLFTDNTLKNTKGIGEKQFNFDELRPGIYFFVLDAVRNGEIKQREVRKIIKV